MSEQEGPPKPFNPTPIIFRIGLATAGGIVLAVIYGILTRFALDEMLDGASALSIAFFCLTPIGLGFLTVMIAPEKYRTSWTYALIAPWIPTVACMLITALFNWEFVFCLVLALPMFLIVSSFGGGFARIAWTVIRSQRNSQGGRLGALVIVLILPYVSAGIERAFPAQTDVRRVESTIMIEAPADVVWGQITNLDPIAEEERPVSFYHVIGLPRPIEARMACPQVGCIRRGSWENGLSFDGTITQIEAGRSYWVSLKADTSQVHSNLAPLRGVGGKTFGMVDDGYEITPLGDGRVTLRLISTYRVTSRFNGYASLWLDFLMRDIQSSILAVEKARAEQIAQGG